MRNANKMIRIQDLGMRIIRTRAGSLGYIDYHIVLYDKRLTPSDDIWPGFDEAEIAEGVYESGEYKGFFVIHSSSTTGKDIRVCSRLNRTFSSNLISCDSILCYHCLSLNQVKEGLMIRSGFHECIPPATLSDVINDWDSMTLVSGGMQQILVNTNKFVSLYREHTLEWHTQVVPFIDATL